MNNHIRQLWAIAAAALLIASVAFFAPGASAADETTAPSGDVETGPAAGEAGAPPDEMQVLRQRIEAAETQIQLLKSVVVQALRAQSAAEEALQREREARDVAPAAGPEATESQDLMLSDHLEALTENLALLRADVAALRAEALGGRAPPAAASGEKGSSAPEMDEEPEPGAAMDDPIADSGVGGAYDPLIDDESAAFAAGGAIEVGLVYFDTGSADLSPGGERKALEAVDRIQAMEAAKVRVVGHADTVGEAGYNRDLSTDRARAIARVLQVAGLPDDVVEIVGLGEEGIPVATSDQVSEPLNRIATIFVVMDSPK